MSIFCYCEATDTIRTLPENYLVLDRTIGGRWSIGNCDPALPVDAFVFVGKLLHTEHNLRYGSPLCVLAAITPYTIGEYSS